MLVPNRHGSSNSYRYGFNGKEKDDELKGEGNHFDYGMRNYDPRVGRFFSVDPLTSVYPYLTPYQFASNRPIDGNDLDGKEWAAKSSESENQDGTITITTSLIVKIKVINESTKITSPDIVKAKAEIIKTGIENAGKRSINYTENGKNYNLIIDTKVVLDYNPPHDDDPGQIGFLIFDDRKSTKSVVKTFGPQNQTITTTTITSTAGDNKGEVNRFETRIAITLDGTEVDNTRIMNTGVHEIFGHSTGLQHPWELKDTEKLSFPSINQMDLTNRIPDLILHNFMNSGENPDAKLRKDSNNSYRNEILDGQIRHIINNIFKNAVWDYEELEPKSN